MEHHSIRFTNFSGSVDPDFVALVLNTLFTEAYIYWWYFVTSSNPEILVSFDAQSVVLLQGASLTAEVFCLIFVSRPILCTLKIFAE